MDKELVRNFIEEYQKTLEKKKFTKKFTKDFDDFIKPSKQKESGRIFKKKLKKLLKTI